MFHCRKIVKFGVMIGCSLGLAVTLTGCFGDSAPTPAPKPKPAPIPDYKPTALEDNARGITIASSKPYNCKIMGETDVQEDAGKTKGATKELMKRGAINKLRNEAAYVVQEGQKVMIALTKETIRCKQRNPETKQVSELDCTNIDPIPSEMSIISYAIYGDIYECGAK